MGPVAASRQPGKLVNDGIVSMVKEMSGQEWAREWGVEGAGCEGRA